MRTREFLHEVMSLAWQFVKRNGYTMSEAMKAITGTDNRKKNDTVQTYYDTERQEFRCFKKANLMSIA